jgi:hypothetical protein
VEIALSRVHNSSKARESLVTDIVAAAAARSRKVLENPGARVLGSTRRRSITGRIRGSETVVFGGPAETFLRALMEPRPLRRDGPRVGRLH